MFDHVTLVLPLAPPPPFNMSPGRRSDVSELSQCAYPSNHEGTIIRDYPLIFKQETGSPVAIITSEKVTDSDKTMDRERPTDSGLTTSFVAVLHTNAHIS